MSISPIRSTTTLNLQPTQVQAPQAKTGAGVNQVGLTFEKALDSLGQSENASDTLMQKLAAGEDVEIHQVMIAAEQTDVNFRIAMAIRDKLVDAYREVMRMTV